MIEIELVSFDPGFSGWDEVHNTTTGVMSTKHPTMFLNFSFAECMGLGLSALESVVSSLTFATYEIYGDIIFSQLA